MLGYLEHRLKGKWDSEYLIEDGNTCMAECSREPTYHVQLNLQGGRGEEISVLSHKTNLEVQMASLGTVGVCPARLKHSQFPAATAGQRQ